MAAPAFVAASSAISADASAPLSVSPAYPTGTTTDDIVLAQCVAYISGATFGISGNFASIAKVSGANITVEWFWNRVQAGDDTTPEFTSTSDTIFTSLITYRGCLATGTPYEDATTSGQTLDKLPLTAAVTPTVTDSRVVSMMGTGNDPTWTTAPPPANWTTRLDLTSTTGGDTRNTFIELTNTSTKDVEVASAGIGAFQTNAYWASITLALKPVVVLTLGPVEIGPVKIGLTYSLA